MSAGRKTRVLVVDDSAFVRKAVARMLEGHPLVASWRLGGPGEGGGGATVVELKE